MKKKLLSIVLTLCMVVTMLPIASLTAKAAESGTAIVPRTTALDLTKTGTYNNGTSSATLNPANDITDSAEGWEWHTNGATVDGTAYTGKVLVLKGANIQSEDSDSAYGINLPDNTTIVLASGTTNTVVAGNSTGSSDSYGIYSSTSLNIAGTGALNSTGGTASKSSIGVFSLGDIVISGGTIIATGGTASNSAGILAFNNLTISGGTVTATGSTANSGSYGIFVSNTSTGYIKLNGGLVIARSGTATTSNAMNIANSGTLSLLTGSNSANFAVYGESGKYTVIDKNSKDSLLLLWGVIGINLSSDSTTNWGANSGYKAETIDGVKTLTIKNLIINVDTTITGINESYGIRLDGDVTVNLEGTNIIHSGDTDSAITSGIYNMDYSSNTTIQGEGTLVSIGGSPQNSSSYGIRSTGNISIFQGNITAIGGTANQSSGIYLENGTAAISDGNVTAIGGPAKYSSYGIVAGIGKINISGGTGTATGGTATTSQSMNSAPTFSNKIGFLTGSSSTQSAAWGVLPYTITVSPESLDFGSKASGYTAPNAQTVTIQNTGNQSVTLTQPTSTKYVIGTLSKTALAPNETATFTVQPKTGLTYGNRDEAITVSTDHSATATVSAKFAVLDKTAPTATINVNGNTWNSFLNTATFGLFFKDSKTVSVTASDTESGIKTIEYLLSNTKFDTQEAVTGAWTDITSAKQFNIALNSKQYIYVRVTDNDGNVSIINTDGVVLYTDSSATAADITFTKTGTADKSTQVTLNGNTVKKIKNGSDVINPSNYTVETDGKIIFKASYLDSLAAGNYTLIVSYNPMGETYTQKTGNAAPGTTAINLTVAATSSPVNPSPSGGGTGGSSGGSSGDSGKTDHTMGGKGGGTVVPTPDGGTGIKIASSDASTSSYNNVIVNVGSVSVTAPASVLSNAIGSDNSSWLVLSQNTTATTTQTQIVAATQSSGVTPVTTLDVDLTRYYSDGTSEAIHQLSDTATVTINLTAAQIAQIGNSQNAQLLYYDQKTGSLTDMNAVFDLTKGTTTFKTGHFSTFVIATASAVKPSGSITLDTRSYTMSPKNIYDIGVKLVNAQDKTVKVYSSRNGIAKVSKLANGNYRITGLKQGVSFVIFEIYDKNGKLLNHASTKVTIANGVKPHGEAVRAKSVF